MLLYDLRNDPGEQHDVSAEHPELTESMRAEAIAWWTDNRMEGEIDESIDPEIQEQLRALGYAN